MSKPREIGSLWIGGALSWLEYTCLKSFAENGHPITLFTYSDVGPLPDGVRQEDGRNILDTDYFIKHRRKDSYALFSDLFRTHMVSKRPGIIWVDSDTYCYRPVVMEDEYVFGMQNSQGSLGFGVFGAPAQSDLILSMVDFMKDLYPIPEYLGEKNVAQLTKAKEQGNPVHVSDLPWGTWGPKCVTWFTSKTDTAKYAQPTDIFYPVPYSNRRVYLKAPSRFERFVTERSTAVNVFASNKVMCVKNDEGLPPSGSMFEKLVKAQNVNPRDFPITFKGRKRGTE